MRYFVHLGGVVVAVYTYDKLPDFHPDFPIVKVPDGVYPDIGWLYENGELIEPAISDEDEDEESTL